jgi:hypothetical protein
MACRQRDDLIADGNHSDAALDQVPEQCRQALEFALGPVEFDCYDAALGITKSAKPCRNAAMYEASAEALLTYPTTGIAGCCARAASGHAAAPPRSVMNSRRFTQSPRRRAARFQSELLRQAPWRL